jgi:hypothetical protein
VGLSVAAFLATTSLALLGLDSVRPTDGGDPMEIKLRHFAEHKAEYDLIFIGSSRVYRGFVPSLFEEQVQQAGLSARAFNFGLLGLRAPEAELVLRRIAELEPGRLRWVLVDPEPLDLMFRERNPRARRVIEWHDARTTLTVSEMILDDEDMTPALRWERLGTHFISFLYNLTHVGEARPWIASSLGLRLPADEVEEFLGPAGDGYRPYHGTYQPATEEELEEGERVSKAWDARVRGLARETVDEEPLPEARLGFYRRLQEATEAAGAQLVLVTAPSFAPRQEILRAARQLELPILRFDRPQEHPELYRREHRYRHEHLNDAGARAFTEALARDFSDLVRSSSILRRKP